MIEQLSGIPIISLIGRKVINPLTKEWDTENVGKDVKLYSWHDIYCLKIFDDIDIVSYKERSNKEMTKIKTIASIERIGIS